MLNIKTIGAPLAMASVLVLSGCATAGAAPAAIEEPTGQVSTTRDYDRELREEASRVSSLESELSSRDQRIRELQAQVASGEKTGSSDLFPPNAKPGQCYARVLKPETYRTWDERVLVKEASDRVEIIPARYETVTERVLVKEESSRIETIPATYEMVAEQVLVNPASTRIVEVPATYRTVTEEVLDKPAYTVWKKGPASTFGNAVVSQSVSGTGEVMCLVEVPATYKTISRSVVDVAAHTKKVEVPAEYKTVERRVEKTPPTTRKVVIPAEYASVEVRKLVSPAQEKRIKIPAEYRTLTRTEKTSDAELAWQEVLCEVNATNANIASLQRALDSKGYNVGSIDGVLGRQTLTAVSQFAQRNNIPHGDNYVPIEVVKALDLDI